MKSLGLKSSLTSFLFSTSICLMGSFVALPARADSLTVTANAGWSSVVPVVSVGELDPCTTGGTLQVSAGTASLNACGVAASAGNLANGSIGVSASAFNALPNELPTYPDPTSIATATLNYTFTISSPNAASVIFNLGTEGAGITDGMGCTLPDCFDSATVTVPSTESLTGMRTGVDALALQNNPTFTLTAPVTNGTANVSLTLTAEVECAGPTISPACFPVAVNYLDTVSILGASVYDANGNLIPGNLISESGFNPNATPAPESSSALFLVAGLICLLCISKRAYGLHR